MVVSGSISIDGSSAVRRTCNIQMVTNTIDVNRVDWALRTKFKLYIGLKNTVDPKYEDIIWFPQGIFVLSSYSATYNNQGYNITLQGKDKMSLLNGDMGGNLFARHDFGVTWIYNSDGSYSKKHIPIKEIIREAVHQYAQEDYANIYINDLDTCGVELVEYRGDGVCWTYNVYDRTDGVPSANIMPPGTNPERELEFENKYNEQHGAVPIRYRPAGATYDYEITKRVTYGDTMGYRATDLTYAGELIEDANGTITSMLDKIIKQLGEFEYFYDEEGHFIFQRKKIYFNSAWSSAQVDDNQTYYESKAMSSQFVYEFTSNYLIESFANKPQVNAIKNDYAIWGQKTSADGSTNPIHLRYAIDAKPTDYYSLSRRQTFTTEGANGYDWRWLIYLMAEDNMVAKDRATALAKGLERQTIENNTIVDSPLYECDPDLITQNDYDHLYYYDSAVEKFIPVAWDASERTSDEQLGRRRIQTYALQNIPLFTAELEESWYASSHLTAEERRLINSSGDSAARYFAANLSYIGIYGDDTDRIKEYREGLRPIGDIFVYYYYPSVVKYFEENYGFTDAYQLFDEAFRTVINQGLGTQDSPGWLRQWYNNLETEYGSFDKDDDDAWAAFKSWIQDTKLIELNGTPSAPFYGQYKYALYSYYTEHLADLVVVDTYHTDKARRETQKLIAQWKDAQSSNYAAYYADMLAFLPALYKIEREITWEFNDDGTITQDEAGNPLEHYVFKMEQQENGAWKEVKRPNMTQEDWLRWQSNHRWNPDIFYWDPINNTLKIVDPEALNFWIDFIDYTTDLWQYGPALIGRRSKVVNDDKVKAIYFRDVPDLLFEEKYSSDPIVEYSETLGYSHINISPSLATYLYISSQGKSAKEQLDTMIYESTYYQETITLSTIPIYYLAPNRRIFVQDKKSGISGEYIIKSLNISFAHDGMMSITANRASERII